jgi:uncharacterized membrane protein
MIWLYLGVFLFVMLHFIPGLAPGLRELLVGRIGENPYKGIFSVALLLSVVLIVVGWRSSFPEPIYLPPSWATPAASVLMLFSVMLFGAAQQPTRIRRYVRHPQLTGMAVWSGSHLLANGDSRSLILFGGLGVWAVLEMLLINRREGPWKRPHAPALSVEIRGIVISAVVFFVLVYLHPYFAGVSPIPR